MDTSLLDELILHCDAEALSSAATAAFLAGNSREEFCDAFSRHVAREYAAGKISFETSDAAMNRLFAFAYLENDYFLPPYSQEVFKAFDEGEYRHSEDPPGTDSEKKYTRPRILQIVARG